MSSKAETNRLGGESSLYLRQHADNPVHWHPWDDAALDSAKAAGKPILLSIGYSACHWCHVMAHESFEDSGTADVMNALYVNIKVDREERPDLDKLYQLCHQFLTGRGGGWPLTLFLDPVEQVPFFAGTYFPPNARYGMPSFRDVLVRARQWFDENPEAVKSQGERLKQAIEAVQAPAGPESSGQPEIDAVKEDISAFLGAATSSLLSAFDRQHGGFGGAPKFPQAPALELVAAIARTEGADSDALDEAFLFTLERMALSGLRDHLDGGFFRYCVDNDWTIPHFEKMLYDNAQLLPLYAEAAARTSGPVLAEAAAGIAGWMKDHMLQPDGGFAASIDADADGEEGGFHVWTREQVQELLSEDDYEVFAGTYGLDRPPNFEGKAWHLVRQSVSTDAEGSLAPAREALASAREERVHPARDDKRLTSWNALAAGGLMRASRAMAREEWADTARQVLDFIRESLWQEGRLLAVHNHGRSRFTAYLDDHAFLLAALLESLRTRWRRADLEFAMDIADAMLEKFEDRENGGFYFSDGTEDVPIARCVVAQDDATPSGYGVAIRVLNELGHLLGDVRLTESADRALARAMPAITQSALGFATAARALISAASPTPQVIINGPDRDGVLAMQQAARSDSPVNCYAIENDDNADGGAGKAQPLPGMLAEFQDVDELTAWVCLGMKCLPPVHSAEALQGLLGN